MIDLHMHSRYSEDGEFTSAELVEQCYRKGIAAMSITDHNCVRANAEARAAAETKDIRYISGIEIDCVYKGLNFHVLGYGIDEQGEDFTRIEMNIKQQSLFASLACLEKTQALGFYITQNEMRELSKGTYWKESWSGEMFAELLLAKPEYAEHPLLCPYRPGGARGDNPYVNFYWDYYAQGNPCYVKMTYPPMDEIIGIIEDLAAAQTRRYHYSRRVHVSLYWGPKDGHAASTDNLLIRINAGHPLVTKVRGRENRYQVICGMFTHELGYVLHTDFLAEQTHMNYFASYRWYPYPPELKTVADARREKAFWDYVKAAPQNLGMAQIYLDFTLSTAFPVFSAMNLRNSSSVPPESLLLS